MTLTHYQSLYDTLVASLRNGDIDEDEFEREVEDLQERYTEDN